ncbi:hypothetical protein BJ878DRAFT_515500 [Calycina marina]|uniref:Uncharacterized protein n=1 Tax=Calycina marina TaxID=1763456 RepID=A0A9P7YYR3_9HELO|nr:hypothetical protein BJ878DRAFT_515500 [Calycina marina]
MEAPPRQSSGIADASEISQIEEVSCPESKGEPTQEPIFISEQYVQNEPDDRIQEPSDDSPEITESLRNEKKPEPPLKNLEVQSSSDVIEQNIEDLKSEDFLPPQEDKTPVLESGSIQSSEQTTDMPSDGATRNIIEISMKSSLGDDGQLLLEQDGLDTGSDGASPELPENVAAESSDLQPEMEEPNIVNEIDESEAMAEIVTMPMTEESSSSIEINEKSQEQDISQVGQDATSDHGNGDNAIEQLSSNGHADDGQSMNEEAIPPKECGGESGDQEAPQIFEPEILAEVIPNFENVEIVDSVEENINKPTAVSLHEEMAIPDEPENGNSIDSSSDPTEVAETSVAEPGLGSLPPNEATIIEGSVPTEAKSETIIQSSAQESPPESLPKESLSEILETLDPPVKLQESAQQDIEEPEIGQNEQTFVDISTTVDGSGSDGGHPQFEYDQGREAIGRQHEESDMSATSPLPEISNSLEPVGDLTSGIKEDSIATDMEISEPGIDVVEEEIPSNIEGRTMEVTEKTFLPPSDTIAVTELMIKISPTKELDRAEEDPVQQPSAVSNADGYQRSSILEESHLAISCDSLPIDGQQTEPPQEVLDRLNSSNISEAQIVYGPVDDTAPVIVESKLESSRDQDSLNAAVPSSPDMISESQLESQGDNFGAEIRSIIRTNSPIDPPIVQQNSETVEMSDTRDIVDDVLSDDKVSAISEHVEEGDESKEPIETMAGSPTALEEPSNSSQNSEQNNAGIQLDHSKVEEIHRDVLRSVSEPATEEISDHTSQVVQTQHLAEAACQDPLAECKSPLNHIDSIEESNDTGDKKTEQSQVIVEASHTANDKPEEIGTKVEVKSILSNSAAELPKVVENSPPSESSSSSGAKSIAVAVGVGAAAGLLFGEVISDNNEKITEKDIVDEPEKMSLKDVTQNRTIGDKSSAKMDKRRSSKHRSSRHSTTQSKLYSLGKDGPTEESLGAQTQRKRRDSETSSSFKDIKSIFTSASSKKPSRHDSGVSVGESSSHTKKQRSPEEKAAHDRRKEERRKALRELESVTAEISAVELAPSVPKRLSSRRNGSSRHSQGVKGESDEQPIPVEPKRTESVVKSAIFMGNEAQVKNVTTTEVKTPTKERARFANDVQDLEPLERQHTSHHHSRSHRSEADKERHRSEQEKEARRARKATEKQMEVARGQVEEESHRQREKDAVERQARREERRRRRAEDDKKREFTEKDADDVKIQRRRRREMEEKEGESSKLQRRRRENEDKAVENSTSTASKASRQDRDVERPQTSHRKSGSRATREKEREKGKDKGPLKSVWSFLKKEFA